MSTRPSSVSMIWLTMDFRRCMKKEWRRLLRGGASEVLGSAPVAVAAEGAFSGGEDEQPEGIVERSDGRPMVVMSVRLSAT